MSTVNLSSSTATNSQTEQSASSVYQGHIRHRRFTAAKNSFNYQLYMLALDVDDMMHQLRPEGLFGFSWYKPLRFCEKDYLKGEPGTLRERITNKIERLGGKCSSKKILMLVQVRCFGLYFSPANFYFSFGDDGTCQYMLAEVSNTPWNQRHYYLVDIAKQARTKKNFHVSPFMDLNMEYQWVVRPPSIESDKLLIHIENHRISGKQTVGRNNELPLGDKELSERDSKLFDATLALEKSAFNRANLTRVWLQLPMMTIKIVAGIYYQALKLWLKKVPFVPYQKGKVAE